ncbi:ARL14 effector protein-like [Haliotis rufescens]|uniref:ARL14 effector protein-like n=1 Tax=Haliotis rufescens TaxID=6454 RepID=UPI001EB04239|nr:ARL14 effector protein-like [Haliotis rufescens]
MEGRTRLRSVSSPKTESKRNSTESRQFHSEISNSSDNSNSSLRRNDHSADPDRNEDEDGVSKELKMLSYGPSGGHGKFMEDFDPERSGREMRKMNRRIYRESVRKNQLYDETGRLFENSKDLCDCLEVDCPGCHFPCSKCGSEKCGSECRCNRKWVYESVEVEGTDIVIKWPT